MALAGFGILVGLLPGLPHVHPRPDLILAVFVPALVFEAALNLDLPALRSVVWPVALLATAGVAISVGVVGLLAHLLIGLDWPAALLLGAILSPTDPIAVVGVVRRSGAPSRLAALLEGESLFNDGTGVAAFGAVLFAISTGRFSGTEIGLDFLLLAGAGAGVGALVGLAGAALVRATTSPALEVALTLLVAYGSYAAATAVGASGVMAVVVAGVAMARVATWGRRTERSWARIALVLNAVLFTLIGLGLPARAVFGSLGAVLLGFAILLAARLIPVYLFGRGIPARWLPLLWWGGVRGALSAALALAAAEQPGVAAATPVIAYGVVILSLLCQGTLVRPAVRLAGRSGEAT